MSNTNYGRDEVRLYLYPRAYFSLVVSCHSIVWMPMTIVLLNQITPYNDFDILGTLKAFPY
jgi:hypothetical protein